MLPVHSKTKLATKLLYLFYDKVLMINSSRKSETLIATLFTVLQKNNTH